LQQETETPCFVVQGYKPSACVRKILDHLVSRFNLPGIYQKNSLEQYAQLVREKFEENDNKMFLIVHSIDSQGLRFVHVR
jgi:hypothetical protein